MWLANPPQSPPLAARLLSLWRGRPPAGLSDEPPARAPVDIDIDALASQPSVHWMEAARAEDGWATRPAVMGVGKRDG